MVEVVADANDDQQFGLTASDCRFFRPLASRIWKTGKGVVLLEPPPPGERITWIALALVVFSGWRAGRRCDQMNG